jgi:hypothetical protein
MKLCVVYKRSIEMQSVLNRVASLFTPPPTHVEPFRPPVSPIENTTFDIELKKYLDYELDTYMAGRDMYWRDHKKFAVRLLKLHPATYKLLDA